MDQAVKDAQKAFDDGQKALAKGDWKAYGDAQKALQAALQQAADAEAKATGPKS